MAGDWIKVEHATTDKAEVLRIAELLGISRRECLGLLLEFWVWLDKNCNASVTLLSRKSLDEVMHTPGFAACLSDVGWVVFDDKTGLVRVINFDRHNGNPAKSRALTQERVKRSRNVTVTPVALPEKRREEKSITTKARAPSTRKAKTPLPLDFKISDNVKSWAAEKGHTLLDRHLEAFVSKVAANGYQYIDWDAAFMNCIREDWGKVHAGPKLAAVPATSHGSYLPAKLPVLEPHTAMPDDARAALSKFLKTKIVA